MCVGGYAATDVLESGYLSSRNFFVEVRTALVKISYNLDPRESVLRA